MKLKNPLRSISLYGVLDFIATFCAILIPFILVAGVWFYESHLVLFIQVLVTDLILLGAAYVGDYIVERLKSK